jgi:hypothetical protein
MINSNRDLNLANSCLVSSLNNLYQTKRNIKKEYNHYRYNFENQRLDSSPTSTFSNDMCIDLSGYLIFVTSNHSGCIRVYGKY